MKNSFKFILSIVLLCVFSNHTKAQGEAALPSLYFNPSPELTGLGWTGVSLPNEDAFGFYYNPAMLGYFSQTNNLAVQYSPETDWLNLDRLKINSFAFSLGYNFKDLLNGLNLSAGFGFLKNKFDYGKFVITGPEGPTPIGSYDPYDSYNAFGFGVSLDYYVNLSVGMSYKDIESESGVYYTNGNRTVVKINASAISYGLLLKVPVIKLIDKDFSWELSDNSSLKPVFNYALGYSRSNIGDEIYFIDPAQKDPLPLTARLGHTFTFGIDLISNNINFNLLTYNLILEADDILIERPPYDPLLDVGPNYVPSFSYQGMLGDIKFGKHLIELKGDDKVVVHKGHKINFGETVAILIGSFSGRGYGRVVKTGGIIVGTKGIAKLFSALSDNSLLDYIAKHFELKYVSSTIFKNEGFETNLSGIQLTFGDFSF